MEDPKTKLDCFQILSENKIKGYKNPGFNDVPDIIEVKFIYQEKNKYFVKGTFKLKLEELNLLGRILAGFNNSSLVLQILEDDILPDQDCSVDFDKDTPPLNKIHSQDIYKLYMLKKHPILFKLEKKRMENNRWKEEMELPQDFYNR
jgi:hypothetical protein